MRILITGGAGFIGSHLVERLLKEDNFIIDIEDNKDGSAKSILDGKGNRIIVVDDFSEGKWINLPKDPRLVIYEASILGDIGNLFAGVDVVFHLAALTRPQWSILHPKETNRVNVDGTLKILQHCKENNVKRLVFVSSSSVYGQVDKLPTPEDIIPNPMSPYALSKLIGEQYCKLFENLYGLQSNCIRPFNVYGTRQNPTGEYAAAVPRFIDRVNSFMTSIKKGETPVITGDGEQVRDFVYVEDVVELMVMAAKSNIHGEVFNAGSGKNISINKLYQTICSIMDVNIKPTYIDPVIEPRETLADISKAHKLLGWKPITSLEEGLRKTILG